MPLGVKSPSVGEQQARKEILICKIDICKSYWGQHGFLVNIHEKLFEKKLLIKIISIIWTWTKNI